MTENEEKYWTKTLELCKTHCTNPKRAGWSRGEQAVWGAVFERTLMELRVSHGHLLTENRGDIAKLAADQAMVIIKACLIRPKPDFGELAGSVVPLEPPDEKAEPWRVVQRAVVDRYARERRTHAQAAKLSVGGMVWHSKPPETEEEETFINFCMERICRGQL